MSIVDALEKAKRLQKERQQAEASSRRGFEASQPARQHEQHAAAPAHLPRTEPVSRAAPSPVRPDKALGLPLVPYDVATCIDNRLLVPENEKEARRGATPSYRQLRTRILQRARGSEWSVLALTSAGPGEGKSVTSLNLAFSLARDGNQDVFLIDCDMRNPSICRYLGVKPPREITDYFNGSLEAHELLFGVGIDRLAIAGGTVGTDSASELLANGRFEQLVAHVRSLSPAPLVLVDLPPVINTDDALVVAPRVDALVIVASEGVTRREDLEKTVDLLSEYPVAGVILNRTAETVGTYYYGSGY